MCSLSAFQTLLDFARLLVCSPFSILLCLFLSIPTFPVSALQTLLDFARLLVCAPQIYRFSLTCIFLCVPCLHFRHCWTLRVCLCALLFLCCVYIFIFSYVSRVCTSILLGFARMLVCLLFRHCWTSMSSLQTLLDSNVFTSDTAGLQCLHFRHCWASHVCLCDFNSDTAGLQCLHFRHCWALHVCLFVSTSDTAGIQCLQFRHCWALHVCSRLHFRHCWTPMS